MNPKLFMHSFIFDGNGDSYRNIVYVAEIQHDTEKKDPKH